MKLTCAVVLCVLALLIALKATGAITTSWVLILSAPLWLPVLVFLCVGAAALGVAVGGLLLVALLMVLTASATSAAGVT